MNKHTEGPWRFVEGDSNYDVDTLGAIRGGKNDLIICDVYDDGGETQEECEANARLISAAPDLLESLKELVRVVSGTLEGYGVLEGPMQRAEAVIRKAEGS